MNLVVPMAGRGARFADTGVQAPKPLIEVEGRPMIAWALDGIADVLASAQRVVFVVQRAHEERYGLRTLLAGIARRPVDLATVDGVTDGQLCTVLAAVPFMDLDTDLLVASCDTYVRSSIGRQIAARDRACAGIISVARMPGDRWSFARLDESGRVVQVAEKERISDLASTGLYYFASAAELVGIAEAMIAADERTRGEFYVMPAYGKLLARGRRIEVSLADEMHDMGTPDALREFIARGPREEAGATTAAAGP